MAPVVGAQGHHDLDELGVLQPDLIRPGYLPAFFYRVLMGLFLTGAHLFNEKLLIPAERPEIRVLRHRGITFVKESRASGELESIGSHRSI